MSLYRFEITDEHLTLLKNLDWEAAEDGNTGAFGIPYLKKEAPFGDMPMGEDLDAEEDNSMLFSDKVIKDAAMIIYGKKNDDVINDPFQKDGPEYTDEELKHVEKLVGELYLALDIVFYIGEFRTGKFVTEHYMRDWREEE